jgi:hypothetical protein
MEKITTRIKEAIIVLIIICIFFVFVEGLSSTAISLYQLLWRSSPSESSQYDETLGWTGKPDIYVADMYGPGKYVRTNSQGFRNDVEFDAGMQKNKIRIICSGDSFTYGQGVANNHSWCNYLPELDNRLETANLAVPGYGVGQMFLRYRKDGIPLEHSIHIFAFILGDLTRMGSSHKNQYGKPLITIDDDAISVENVPVPRYRWSAARSLTRADFRSADLANRVLARVFPADQSGPTLIERVGPVALKIFQTIHQLDEENNIVPVFVFLPTERDLGKDHSFYRWTVETMSRYDLPFIDLTPALRALPAGRVATFFIASGELGEGHYTEEGNEWVVGELYKGLMKMQRIRTLLSGVISPDSVFERKEIR